MEKIKDLYQNNKKFILYSAGVVVVSSISYYCYQRYRINQMKYFFDPKFKEENLPLYKSEAQLRDKILQNVQYNLYINLTPSEQIAQELKQDVNTLYCGNINIQFNINQNALRSELKQLYIDFQGLCISDVKINNNFINKSDIYFYKHKILIPYKYLIENSTNSINFNFYNTYVNNSAGMHKYIDPKDNNTYIFTHLEPFFCHRWFPCFDQPSIRAPLTLRIATNNKDWKVIGNEMQQEIIENQNDIQNQLIDKQLLENCQVLHIFKQTALLSSYIYALFAGNYKEFKSDYTEIPLRLFIRQSKQDQIIPDEIFDVTIQGFKYYEEFFDRKYPFSKYDQVFQPELRLLAMENAGAVSLTDRYLSPLNERRKDTVYRMYYILLHEMSHMWFGDMVALKWWNDLWLKESIADYIAICCFSETQHLQLKFPNNQYFFVRFLEYALKIDCRSTTHPIQVQVENTEDAMNAFDGICYKKGAIFLRQLNYYLGREVFKKGIQIYFKNFEFKNTSYQDFIDCLQEALNQYGKQINLNQWASNWLKRAGVNQIEDIIQVHEGRYLLKLKQSVPVYGDKVYQEQIIDVTLYDSELQEVETLENIRLNGQQINYIHSALETSKPCGVLVNSNVKGYYRVKLSKDMIQLLIDKIWKVKSINNRDYLWRTLADQIYLHQIKPKEFLECCINNFEKEDQEQIVSFIIQKVKYILQHQINQDNKEYLTNFKKRLFYVYLSVLTNTENAEIKKEIANELFNYAQDDQFDEIIQWLDASHIIVDGSYNVFKLGKNQRYDIIKKIYSSTKFTLQQKQDYLKKEMNIDYSDIDQQKQIEVEACLPDIQNKKNLWNMYMEGKKLNQKLFEASSSSFYSGLEDKYSDQFSKQFRKNINRVFKIQHRDYAQTFFFNLNGTYLNKKQNLQRILPEFNYILKQAIKSKNTHFIKLVKDHIYELEENFQIIE